MCTHAFTFYQTHTTYIYHTHTYNINTYPHKHIHTRILLLHHVLNNTSASSYAIDCLAPTSHHSTDANINGDGLVSIVVPIFKSGMANQQNEVPLPKTSTDQSPPGISFFVNFLYSIVYLSYK